MTLAFELAAEVQMAASSFINAHFRNVFDIEQSDFEASISYDDEIDFVGVIVYTKDGVPVAWYDDENLFGYRAV
jgi:hypothetical protein